MSLKRCLFLSTLQRYNDFGKIPKIFSKNSSNCCDRAGNLRQNAKNASISVAQLGRKFRLISLTMQRYGSFIAVYEFSGEKSANHLLFCCKDRKKIEKKRLISQIFCLPLHVAGHQKSGNSNNSKTYQYQPCTIRFGKIRSISCFMQS